MTLQKHSGIRQLLYAFDQTLLIHQSYTTAKPWNKMLINRDISWDMLGNVKNPIWSRSRITKKFRDRNWGSDISSNNVDNWERN